MCRLWRHALMTSGLCLPSGDGGASRPVEPPDMPRPVLASLAVAVFVSAVAAQPLTVVSSPPAAKVGAAAYFSEKEKDFGVTALGPSLVHYFAITNTSSSCSTPSLVRTPLASMHSMPSVTKCVLGRWMAS